MLAAANNFLFLLFIAIAIFFQLLTRLATKGGRRSGGDSNRRSTSAPQSGPEPEQTDEERIRKFLEALGQPPGSKPPPPIASRPTYPKPTAVPRIEPRRIARPVSSSLPPLTTRPPELPREVRTQPPVITRPRKVFTPTSEVPVFEVHEGPPPLAPISQPELGGSQPMAREPISKTEESKTKLATLLRSSSGLRDAIILREIFGPPRSLQPLDLVGNV